jgi:NADPH:quinone reductase-like Zn-dependent oxidoreductase
VRDVDHGGEQDRLVGRAAAVLRELEIPIARVYPLAEVRAAYRELERRDTLGKIVLVP